MIYYTEKEFQDKFKMPSCPRCSNRTVEVQLRTKGGMAYKVYVCGACKGVIKREIR